MPKKDADPSSEVTIQMSGYLMKKPFSSGGRSGPWQKRFFVLKDGFLFWYVDNKSKKKLGRTFDMHPKGCLPLGGCTVQAVKGRNKYGEEEARAFEVGHADFSDGSLLLAAEDEASCKRWMEFVEGSSRVTWENAQLGDALLEKERAKGTELEAEKAKALSELQLKAETLAQERKAKEDLLQTKAQLEVEKKEAIAATEEERAAKKAAMAAASAEEEQRRKAIADAREKEQAQQALLEEEQARLAALQVTVVKAEAERDSEKKGREAEAERRKRVEADLKAAQRALRKLERAVKAQAGSSGSEMEGFSEDIATSVNDLRSFFAKKIDEVEHRAHSASITKDALRVLSEQRELIGRSSTSD